MDSRFDCVVIGAGLGGLAAATALSKAGMSVLLLEKHNLPGGYATSFQRGRFEFEVALHQLSGIGPPGQRGSLFRILESLGVTDHVEFVNLPNLYRSVFPDLDLTLSAGGDAFSEALCTAFPAEARGIKRFLKRVTGLGKDFGGLVRKRGKVNRALLPLTHRHFFRYLPVTMGQVLNRDVKDVRARSAISQYWGYFGLPPSACSFLYFGVGLASYVKYGPAYPKGRSFALAQAFVSALEKNGGVFRPNSPVKRILVHNGKVTGVRLESGEDVAAPLVVSNADLLTTCRQMIGDELIPDWFFRKLRSSQLGPSTFNVYLGLAGSPQEVGLDEHEVFINRDHDLDGHHAAMTTTEPPPALVLTNYNAAQPDISPPGTSMVVLTALKYGQAWVNLGTNQYFELKDRLARSMLDMAAEYYPGIKDRVETVEISTPLTNLRYVGATGGSIYGFAQPPRDNMVWRLGQRGPVGGLFFTGAWTRPGGGMEAVIGSGMMSAGAVLSAARKQG